MQYICRLMKCSCCLLK